MMKIEEPSRRWEIFHMDWETGLPPGGHRSYNLFLVIFDTFSKTPIFFPSHKDDTDMDTALLTCNRVKTSIHASTNQTAAILEKGWKPRLPQDSLRKDLVEIHPTAASFKGMLDKAVKHAVRCMEDSFAYDKDQCNKSHATPYFKVGYLVLVSTTNFNNIKGCNKLNYSFAGPFAIKALHEENSA
ncbi:hypothetical protein O181_055128 [Austropuccinia psidii MF-1]|uniref:Uncharacterized protein n=1 Tax=Austropuccinia psidii MF-1 TaxID=1389203 RepID=A0A9Q3EAK0_9BASI|nr:hypothetical protein [Austropuccinia psidii MF-1]